MKRFIFMLLATVMILGNTVTAFAMDYPSDLPPLPNGAYNMPNQKGGFIHTYGDTLRAFVVENDVSADIVVVYDGKHTFTISSKDTFYYTTYMYVEAANIWSKVENHKETSSITYSMLIDGDQEELVYSSFDIVDSNGEVVFPLTPIPLAEAIQATAGEALTVEIPKLNQTVLVVVLCGVGCLALVTSLVLLRKILPRFLH